jgi:hypothetical protein
VRLEIDFLLNFETAPLFCVYPVLAGLYILDLGIKCCDIMHPFSVRSKIVKKRDSVLSDAYLSEWDNAALTGRIFMKFDI